MAKTQDLEIAAHRIAEVRMDCAQLGLDPADIARIMLDEAVMGFVASGYSFDDIQAALKRYGKRDLPRFHQTLLSAAAAARRSKLPG